MSIESMTALSVGTSSEAGGIRNDKAFFRFFFEIIEFFYSLDSGCKFERCCNLFFAAAVFVLFEVFTGALIC
jgi:hypothetical protein